MLRMRDITAMLPNNVDVIVIYDKKANIIKQFYNNDKKQCQAFNDLIACDSISEDTVVTDIHYTASDVCDILSITLEM